MSAFASTSAAPPPPPRSSNNENDDSVLKNKIMNAFNGVVASLDERRPATDRDLQAQVAEYKKENVKLFSDNRQLHGALNEECRKSESLAARLNQVAADNERLTRENNALRQTLEERERQYAQLQQMANPTAHQQLAGEHARVTEELRRYQAVMAEMYQKLQQYELTRMPQGGPQGSSTHVVAQSQAPPQPPHPPPHPAANISQQGQPMPMQQSSSAPLPQHIPPHLTYEHLLARQQQEQEQQAQRMQQRSMQQQQQQRMIQQQQLQHALREQNARQLMQHSPPHPGQAGPSSSGPQQIPSRPGSQHGPPPVPVQLAPGSSTMRNSVDGGRGYMVMPERQQLMINTALGSPSMPTPPLSAPPLSNTVRHAMGMPTPPLSDADRRTLSIAQMNMPGSSRQQPASAGPTPMAPSQIQFTSGMREPQRRASQPVPGAQGPPQPPPVPRPMPQQRVGPNAQFRPFIQPQAPQTMGPPPPQPIVHSTMPEGFRPPRPHEIAAHEMTQRAALGLSTLPDGQPSPARSRQGSTSSNHGLPAPSQPVRPSHARSSSGTSIPSSIRQGSYDMVSPEVLGPSVSSLKRPNEMAAMRDPAKRQRMMSEQQAPPQGMPTRPTPQRTPSGPTHRGQPQAEQQRVNAPQSALQPSQSAPAALHARGGPSRLPSERSSVMRDEPRVLVKEEVEDTPLLSSDAPLPPPSSPLTPAFGSLALAPERRRDQPPAGEPQSSLPPESRLSDAPEPQPFSAPEPQPSDPPPVEAPAPDTAMTDMQTSAADVRTAIGAVHPAPEDPQTATEVPMDDGTEVPMDGGSEDDGIRRDADGLQLEPDCVSQIIGVEEDWGLVTECEQCNLLFAEGQIDSPSRFQNPTYEELLDHCKTQHNFVWDDVRAGKF